MVLKVTQSLGRESGFSRGRYCISWASLPHFHPFVFVFSVRGFPQLLGRYGIFWGLLFTFLDTMTPSTTNNPSCSFLRLPHNRFLACPFFGVSTLCLRATECFVFVSCFSRILLTLAGWFGRGWEGLNGSLVGPWVQFGGEDSQFLFSCPHFLAFFRDVPFLLIYPFLLSFPGNFDAARPVLKTTAFWLSVGTRPWLLAFPKSW